MSRAADADALQTGCGCLVLAVAAVVVALGVRGCRADPPRVVAHRYTAIVRESHSCGNGGKHTCYSPVTHYYLVSRDGGVCDVDAVAYWRARRGGAHKCYQLFGWHGGDAAAAALAAGGGDTW